MRGALLSPLWLIATLALPLAAAGEEELAPCPFRGVPSEQELAAHRGEKTPSDLAHEAFLSGAEIIDIEDIGEGITKPRRLTMVQDGVSCRAIFKDIDEETTDISYTKRFEMNFTDRYAYEVAAYRLDRWLGIGLVPVTVLREVEGKEGSAQAWIENAMKMEDAIDQNLPINDMERYFRRVLATHILDHLIYNIDRNSGNILVTIENEGYYLIDHSRSFRTNKKLLKQGEDWAEAVPPELLERLRALDEENLTALLGDLIEVKRIKPIVKRRDLLLRDLKKRGLIE